MKQPWWLVNSILLLLLCAAIIFMFVGRPTMPRRISFEPVEEIKPPKHEITKIDLTKIYGNDLFDTYQQPAIPEPEQNEAVSKPLPPPPTPKIIKMPASPPPRFLEPLSINLKGVIVGSDESFDIAIIEDVKEKKSRNYRVGDKIEDAQLIKIFRNKIILIRSNGQQETLYVNQYDAELEQLLSPRNNWNTIIEKENDTQYKVDPELFVERVSNLAQFIDLLNITTVYQQGMSIGCRIGKMQPTSPGIMLGLMAGDIVQEINGMRTATAADRIEIYKRIVESNLGDIISVKLLRKNTPIILFYKLERLEPVVKNRDQEVSTVPSPEIQSSQKEEQPEQVITTAMPLNKAQKEEQRIFVRAEQRKVQPTINEFKKNDKRIMISQRPQRMSRNRLRDGFEQHDEFHG